MRMKNSGVFRHFRNMYTVIVGQVFRFNDPKCIIGKLRIRRNLIKTGNPV